MKKILLFVVISALISGVYALGIATDYGSDYIKLPQGTKHYKYSFRIQNMDDKSITVRIELYDPNNITKQFWQNYHSIANKSKIINFLPIGWCVLSLRAFTLFFLPRS